MNPVLQEHLDVFFRQGHGLPSQLYPLGTLALIEFLLLTPIFLDAQVWNGAGGLFKTCASVAVVLTVYFTLRAAIREYTPARFKPLRYWLHERGCPVGVVARGRVAFLLVQAGILTLLSAPLLVWAGAISHTPAAPFTATLALIPFYAVCYGIWGLVALALLEGELDGRKLMIYVFTGLVMVAAMTLFLPLNPVVYLRAMASAEEPARIGLVGANWSPAMANLIFHVAYGATGFVVHRWALARGR